MRHRADPPDADSAPRGRLRLGVGAAVVLLLGAFVVAVLTPLLVQRGGAVPVPTGSGAPGASTGSASTGPAGDSSPGPGAGAGELFVHVSGAVVTPGLVVVPAGSRVLDAVAAAGGFTAEADPAGVNLARPLGDGEQLVVPRLGEAPPAAAPPGGSDGAAASSSAKVNLNTAAVSELETLPRIGPALAQRIVDWREANGRFASPDDLRNVTGIGEKIFDGLKDRVTV